MDPAVQKVVDIDGDPCAVDGTMAIVPDVNSTNSDRYFQIAANYGSKGVKKSNVVPITGDEFEQAGSNVFKVIWIHAQDYDLITGKIALTMSHPGGAISEETIITTDTKDRLAAPDKVDYASYTVNIPFPDNWYLWGRMYAKGLNSSNAANSFWVQLDNKTPFKLGNRKDKFNTWYFGGNGQRELGDQTSIPLGFLTQQEYLLSIYDRETIPQSPYLDLLVLSNDPNYVPVDADFCKSDLNEDQPNTDGDASIDICDGCPQDPNKAAPGQCGCGHNDIDDDGDGTALCKDNCPGDPNPDQADRDNDQLGDACDPCPDHANALPTPCGCEQPDLDLDGILDCRDNCPEVANPDQLDTNNNGKGDVCDTKLECFIVNYDGSIPTATLEEILSRPVVD